MRRTALRAIGSLGALLVAAGGPAVCGASDLYGTAYPITSYAASGDVAKYRRIAVLPFRDAPKAEGCGALAQELAAQAFAESGFEVLTQRQAASVSPGAAPGPPSDDREAMRLGRQQGADGVVVGRVIQYAEDRRLLPSMSVDMGRAEVYLPAEESGASVVAVSFRLLDADTGSLVYSASGHTGKPESVPSKDALRSILADMVRRWLESAK